MRKPLVVANWKMNGTRAIAESLSKAIAIGSHDLQTPEVAIAPPFIFLADVAAILKDSRVNLAAQNVSAYPNGAYTGEISAEMLKEYGCRYVIVGHSERRTILGETNEMVVNKCLQLHAAAINPIVCIGESQEQRLAEMTFSVIDNQLDALLSLDNSSDLVQNIVFAYEPIWAIGTGLTATPEQAQEVHAHIRSRIAGVDNKLAQNTKIIYGGSVKSGNAAEIFAMPDIDGGLIGGASLNAQEFLGICQCYK